MSRVTAVEPTCAATQASIETYRDVWVTLFSESGSGLCRPPHLAAEAADTFIVRVGDLVLAGLVYLGTAVLGFGLGHFAIANVVLCLLWLGIGFLLLR